MEIGGATASLGQRQGWPYRRSVVGKDTRVSGSMLESAPAAAIALMGVDVWLAGRMPTPSAR